MSAFLCKRLDDCVENILAVANSSSVLQHDPVVRRAIEGRIPYTNALNIIQAEVLRMLRAGADGASRHVLEDTMVVTIQGIASGMGMFMGDLLSL